MKNVDLINIQRSLKRLRITHNIFLPIIFFELLIHKHLCEKFFSLLSKKKYKFNIKNYHSFSNQDEKTISIYNDFFKENGYFIYPSSLFNNFEDKFNDDNLSSIFLEELNDIVFSLNPDSWESIVLLEIKNQLTCNINKWNYENNNIYNIYLEIKNLTFSSSEEWNNYDFRIIFNKIIEITSYTEPLIYFVDGKSTIDTQNKDVPYLTPRTFVPTSLSKLLSKLIISDAKKITSIFDPACNSGSILLEIKKEIDKHYYGVQYIGEEYHPDLFCLLSINRSLYYDEYISVYHQKQTKKTEFDLITCYLPSSFTYPDNDFVKQLIEQYPKFKFIIKAENKYCDLLGTQKLDDITYFDMAEYISVYILDKLNEKGTAYIICNTIPESLIKSNSINTIIVLPTNSLTSYTSKAHYILIIKKEPSKYIRYINALSSFEHGVHNDIISNENIDYILNLYLECKSKFSDEEMIFPFDIDHFSNPSILKKFGAVEGNYISSKYGIFNYEDISKFKHNLDETLLTNQHKLTPIQQKNWLKKTIGFSLKLNENYNSRLGSQYFEEYFDPKKFTENIESFLTEVFSYLKYYFESTKPIDMNEYKEYYKSILLATLLITSSNDKSSTWELLIETIYKIYFMLEDNDIDEYICSNNNEINNVMNLLLSCRNSYLENSISINLLEEGIETYLLNHRLYINFYNAFENNSLILNNSTYTSDLDSFTSSKKRKTKQDSFENNMINFLKSQIPKHLKNKQRGANSYLAENYFAEPNDSKAKTVYNNRLNKIFNKKGSFQIHELETLCRVSSLSPNTVLGYSLSDEDSYQEWKNMPEIDLILRKGEYPNSFEINIRTDIKTGTNMKLKYIKKENPFSDERKTEVVYEISYNQYKRGNKYNDFYCERVKYPTLLKSYKDARIIFEECIKLSKNDYIRMISEIFSNKQRKKSNEKDTSFYDFLPNSYKTFTK